MGEITRGKYKPEFCEMIVKFCEGGSTISAFAAEIGVARETIYDWCSDHVEFRQAFKEARTRQLAFWENMGKSAMVGMLPKDVKSFDRHLYMFFMKKMFHEYGYGDTVTILNPSEPTTFDI